MSDRSLKLSALRAILKRYDVTENTARGKGSHTYFEKTFVNGTFGYPVPTHGKEVMVCYVKGCRKTFRLTVADGISDREFYD